MWRRTSPLEGVDLGAALPDAGRALERAGLDAALPRALHAEGRLLTWLQAWSAATDGDPVGHCAVADHGETASVEVLATAPATSAEVDLDLLWTAVTWAATHGRPYLTSTLDHPAFGALGFERDEAGWRIATSPLDGWADRGR